MQRDMELVRAILKVVQEQCDGSDAIENLVVEGYERNIVHYHLGLLVEVGYIKAIDCSSKDGAYWMPEALTWEGHEFLDAASNESVWQQAMAKIKGIGGNIALDLMKTLLLNISKEQLGLPAN